MNIRCHKPNVPRNFENRDTFSGFSVVEYNASPLPRNTGEVHTGSESGKGTLQYGESGVGGIPALEKTEKKRVGRAPQLQRKYVAKGVNLDSKSRFT